MKQIAMLQNEKSAYGGELLKTRAGRAHGRPLATRNTMHLVLRSSRARGDWSFRRPRHAQAVERLTRKFATKYGVRLVSLANVGNHLHFQIQLANRRTYPAFIRALTSSIAMAVTSTSRWKPLEGARFWDYRPFTRVVVSLRALLNLRDYIRINQLEGAGHARDVARMLVKKQKADFSSA